MWTRRELKERAKIAFKRNYWRCVLVALILTLLTGSFSFRSTTKMNGQNQMPSAEQQRIMQDISKEMDELSDAPFLRSYFSLMRKNLQLLTGSSPRQSGVIAAILGGLGLVSVVLSILVFNPLIVGCYRFFLENRRGDGELKHLGAGFQDNWGNVVLVMFLRNLFLVLWTLLFIVPGIVKSYSYRLTPYILRDRPELSGTEAITLSRQMMKGHKWNTFVLDLSFLGWALLSILTAGILAVFYVGPYYQATDAELYEAIRGEFEAQPQFA